MENNVVGEYPVNVLNWLGVPVIDIELQYDRIDDILNAITKGYNPHGAKMMKDVFIAKFVAGLSSMEIEDRGLCNKGEWSSEKLMAKLRRDIRHHHLYMDYLSLLRNTYHDRFDRLNCDVFDSQITCVPSKESIMSAKNIWGLTDIQWYIVRSVHCDGLSIGVVCRKLGMPQQLVQKSLDIALESMRANW